MIRLDEAVQERSPRNGAYPTIFVDGRGASGKTTLADFLGARLDGFTVVHGDDYFEPHNDAITWGDFNEVRFDADVLSHVRAGDRAIALRPFDFPNGRIGDAQSLTITGGLVVERWLGLFLDAPWDERAGRSRGPGGAPRRDGLPACCRARAVNAMAYLAGSPSRRGARRVAIRDCAVR